MRRFRIVETRTLSGDPIKSVPYFYIEEAERFLFFTVWNRFLTGHLDRQKAEDLVKAMTEASSFKDRIV